MTLDAINKNTFSKQTKQADALWKGGAYAGNF